MSLPVDFSFFSVFSFCPPECFNSLCNFLLLPTLKSEGRRLGKKREKRNDLQHMIAKHYTEVSLRNIQNISAYQLRGDVTGFIFGCEPDNTFDSPSLRGSESEEGRLDVWGEKRQRKRGGVFLPVRATYCMTGSDYGCAAGAAASARTDTAPRRAALRLSDLFITAALPLLSPSFHLSAPAIFPPLTCYFFSLPTSFLPPSPP